MPTEEENKASFRRYLEEAWNQSNLEVVDEIFDRYLSHQPDGSTLERVAVLPAPLYASLRWSPDDRWIAFQRSNFSAGFEVALETVSIPGGERREVTSDSALNGFSWLPDSSGFVYSSSRGSTMRGCGAPTTSG